MPQARELDGVRNASFWIFNVLFDVPNVAQLIESEIVDRTQNNLPKRPDETDMLIDDKHGLVEIAGQMYYTSDVIYALDPVLYSEMGNEIRSSVSGGGVTA